MTVPAPVLVPGLELVLPSELLLGVPLLQPSALLQLPELQSYQGEAEKAERDDGAGDVSGSEGPCCVLWSVFAGMLCPWT